MRIFDVVSRTFQFQILYLLWNKGKYVLKDRLITGEIGRKLEEN